MNIIQIEKLSEKKSVSELFKELFPEEECPFYGGYGYAENDLVSIDAASVMYDTKAYFNISKFFGKLF